MGRVQWKIDFSGCGLVVSRVEVKAKWMDFGEEGEEEEPVQFTVVGDNKVICAPYLGGGWCGCGCVRERGKEGGGVSEGGREDRREV